MLENTVNPALAGITDQELSIVRMLLDKVEMAYVDAGQMFRAVEAAKVLKELVNEACARDDAGTAWVKRIAA